LCGGHCSGRYQGILRGDLYPSGGRETAVVHWP
jgi:hypothetical protein